MTTKKKRIKPGNRVMDVGYIQDGKIRHTGEALLVACLMHVRGKTKRGKREMEEIQRIMKDPNYEPLKS